MFLIYWELLDSASIVCLLFILTLHLFVSHVLFLASSVIPPVFVQHAQLHLKLSIILVLVTLIEVLSLILSQIYAKPALFLILFVHCASSIAAFPLVTVVPSHVNLVTIQ